MYCIKYVLKNTLFVTGAFNVFVTDFDCIYNLSSVCVCVRTCTRTCVRVYACVRICHLVGQLSDGGDGYAVVVSGPRARLPARRREHPGVVGHQLLRRALPQRAQNHHRPMTAV